MIRRPPRSTRTDTLFPYTPRFRSPVAVGGRVITVRFNADVDPALPWAFQPVEREMTLRVGESGLTFFRAENLSAHPTAGTATFNVTPLKAGQYFNKVQCFCFTEQRLAAGASRDMPGSYFEIGRAHG